MSKINELYRWMLISNKQFYRTSEIIKLGAKNFSNRAERNARQLAKDGFLIRLTQIEKIGISLRHTKEGVYRVCSIEEVLENRGCNYAK